MPPTTPRIDVSRKTVAKAKRAMGLRDSSYSITTEKDLEGIAFSDTLKKAAEVYLPQVIEHLNAAGFRKHPALEKSEKRPRRVDSAVWEELGKVAEQQGTSRMELVRALLNLLGDEYDRHEPGQTAKPATK